MEPIRIFLCVLRGSSQSRAPTQPSSRVRRYHLRQRPSQKLVLCPKPWQVEFKESMCPAEREGMWPDLVTELLQGEGLVLSEVGNP